MRGKATPGDPVLCLAEYNRARQVSVHPFFPSFTYSYVIFINLSYIALDVVRSTICSSITLFPKPMGIGQALGITRPYILK